MSTNYDHDNTNRFPPDQIPDPGGYVLAALMDDGGTLCERCVRDPDNPVHDDRLNPPGALNDGWGVVAFYTSGDCDDFTACDHCGRTISEGVES